VLAEVCILAANNDVDRLRYAFRKAVCRLLDDSGLATLQTMITEATAEFANNSSAATELLSVGATPRNATLPPDQLAAWTTAMSVLLNLDETISRLKHLNRSFSRELILSQCGRLMLIGCWSV
jgi:hypothetical protein